MPYWSLPENAIDDPDEATRWALKALEPARKAAGREGSGQGAQGGPEGTRRLMAKTFEIPAGEKRRRPLAASQARFPGQVRFRAEAVNGGALTGKVELARRRWFTWERDEFDLHARNVFDKGVTDSDYRIFVTPDQDARITFETRHFRAEYLWKIILGLLVLAVLSPLVAMLISKLVS